jgi:hypothetical protein
MNANAIGNLGFIWNSQVMPTSVPSRSVEWACFRMYKMIPEFAWELSRFENSPLTFPEIKTLIDGDEIFSKYPDTEAEITAIGRGIRYLLALVRSNRFRLDETTILGINRIIADASVFNSSQADGYVDLKSEGRKSLSRGENFGASPSVLGGQPFLNEAFKNGIRVIDGASPSPFQKAAALFLLGESCELIGRINRPTIQLALNGVLLSAGIEPINIPFARHREYSRSVEQFRRTKDGSKLAAFLVSCHPDVEAIYKANPQLLSHLHNDSVVQSANVAS